MVLQQEEHFAIQNANVSWDGRFLQSLSEMEMDHCRLSLDIEEVRIQSLFSNSVHSRYFLPLLSHNITKNSFDEKYL